MTSVVLYFHVHQPFRLRPFTFFDIGRDQHYFDDGLNEAVIRRVANRCYLPMTGILRRLVEQHEGRFKCAISIAGTALDQMERWAPEALQAFQALARTGGLELVCETSHHSLAFLADETEFRAQIEAHRERLEGLFGQRPTTFRNTELVIDDRVARVADDLGFTAILGEGADHLLGWRNASRVYRAAGTDDLKVLLRDYGLSDDIAFRFSNQGWCEYPLMADKFGRWVHEIAEEAQQIGLFMDFETAGEHQWAETGILDFFEHMPGEILRSERFTFRTPSEVAELEPARGVMEVPHPVSWADEERDLSAWLGNPLQQAANDALYALLPDVHATGDADLLETWRRLSTSDHVYYMSTKGWTDGEVHAYFSPYDTPHDAYTTFMNVLDDLSRRVRRALGRSATPPSGARD